MRRLPLVALVAGIFFVVHAALSGLGLALFGVAMPPGAGWWFGVEAALGAASAIAGGIVMRRCAPPERQEVREVPFPARPDDG